MRPRRPIGLLVLAVSITALVLRDLRQIVRPTLFAEEGAMAFETAWLGAPFEVLVTPYAGYFSGAVNVAVFLAANCVPLEAAPFVTMLCALVITQLPLVQVLASRNALFAAPLTRFGTLLALVLLSGFPVSMVYSHPYLVAVAFLALLEETTPDASRRRRLVNRGLLLFAATSSPLVGFLLPAAALVAWRQRALRPAACCLLAGVGVQALAMFATFPAESRSAMADFLFLPPVVLLNFLDAVLPAVVLEPLHTASYEIGKAGALAKSVQALVSTALLALGLWWLGRRLPRHLALLFVGAVLGIGILTMAFGGNLLDDNVLGTPPRYTFGTHVIVVIAIAHFAASSWAGRVLFVLALVAAFGHGWRATDHSQHPDWAAEVAAWRADPGHMIKIRPQGWTVLLQAAPPPIDIRAQRFGSASGPVAGLPSLAVERIENGGRTQVIARIRTATPGAKGEVLLTRPGPATTIGIGGGRTGTSYLDLTGAALMRIEFRTDASGRWTGILRAREFAQFADQPLRSQALVHEPTAALSNAVDLQITRR